MSTVILNHAKGAGDFLRLRFWGTVLLMLGALLALSAGSANAAPLAGTAIGNQAAASYRDNNNIERLTVSNAVSTVVSQVYSATLTLSQTKAGAPGQTLAFPHTINNLGNGPATFSLAVGNVTAGAFATAPVTGNTYFADNNCDGVADNNTTITTVGPVAPGAQACFVAQLSLASSGTASAIQVEATGNGVLMSNTDSVTISTNAVISLTKAISVSAGPTGTRATYTLTYRNTGNISAGSVVIADLIPTGATYLNNSATWSSLTTAALTDTNDAAVQGLSGNQIRYATSSTGVLALAAVIERVDPGVQGTLSFVVDITGSGPVINNSAYFCYRDQGANGTIQPTVAASTVGINTGCSNIIGAAGGFTAAAITFTDVTALAVAANPQVSNTVPFTVVATNNGASIFNDGRAGGTGGDGLAGTGLPVDGTNTTFNTISGSTGGAGSSGTFAVADFDVVPATAGQGTMATWDAYVWNTGGSTDTYNISVPSNNFPSGTTFLLFRSDRATPLTDSNGDGVIDTGPVPGYGVNCPGLPAPGATTAFTASSSAPCVVRVYIVAQLPPGGTGGPYDVVLRSTSGNTPASFNQVIARLQTVTRSKVDLYNVGELANSGARGFYGAANPATAINTITATPGGSATFGLVVNNPGTVADSYDLAYNVASSGSGVTGAFNTGAAPYAFTTVCQFGTDCTIGSGVDLRGFTLTFYLDGGLGSCNTLGPTLTNTGVITPGNSKTVCAIVTVPTVTQAAATGLTNATAITATSQMKIYFRALSPTTYDGTAPAAAATALGNGSSDIKRDDLLLGTSRAVTITPNNSGQAIAGGSIQYCHTVTNAGNVNETLSANQSNQSLFAAGGWPQYATFYIDTNNNCVLDGTEGTAPLANPGPASLGTAFTPGVARNVIVVVQVPGAAAAGQSNVTTISVSAATALTVNPLAIDTTVVVIGQVQLVKEQATDVNCNGVLDGSQTTFTQGQIAASASTAPNNCIVYRVTATNIGTQSVSTVIISDSTPANTKLGPNTCNVGVNVGTLVGINLSAVQSLNGALATAVGTTPGPDTNGSIATSATSLTPGQNVVLAFCVRIDP